VAARRAADFLLHRMRDAEGRLLHRYREGEADIRAHADDYAYLVWGLLELYRTAFDPAVLARAVALQQEMAAHFWDRHQGGFFKTAADSEELPARPKELYDGALPSANSVALANLLTLERVTGDHRWAEAASDLTRAFAGTVIAQPALFTHFLCGLDLALATGREVVIVGEAEEATTREMLAALNHRYLPHVTVLLKTAANAPHLHRIAPFTEKLGAEKNSTTAYVCTDFICRQPVTDVTGLLARVEGGP
jgi:uncharacterized protein YyaL (SSP411 family)